MRLPNIKRLVVNKISDSNSDLASFLSNSVPNKLDLFWMNHSYISNDATKIDFYIESLCEAIKGVSKEIYFENLIVGEKDLEKIVKSSRNWERLVIRWSDILCSSALDFSTDSEYKTKSLSFYNWGYNSKCRKSSWLTDSSLFENIVEGIGKSGLKQSLQTVDIQGCELEKSKVQEMFTKHEIINVSVVEDGKDPMTE